MKKKILLLLFSISFLFCNNIFAQSNIDVLHYRYVLELNDNCDTLKGMAVISFVQYSDKQTASFDLTCINRQGKGMRVTLVSIGTYEIPFTHSADKLTIDLPKNKKGDTIKVWITYKGIPSDGLIISKNKYGQRTFFADNWPDRAHNWIPCADVLTDKASFEFLVTAPSHYKVISNGILVEEKTIPGNNKLTHWKEDTPLPTKVMVIGVADFAVKRYADSPPDIPVTAWIFAKDSIDGFRDYDPAPNILKTFINYIGPYPYKKLANVQSKTIFGGMENASAIFYSESSVTGNHDDESLLAHEIAHQWFGDMVTEKNFAHIWLSEGFASYFAHLYTESRHGTESLKVEMQKDRDKIIDFARISDNPVIDTISPIKKLLNVNSYEKGSWILHMLRQQLGDTVFQKIIRSYYDSYKGKNADTKDLQAVAEKISGKKLDYFFRQWLYSPGFPRLIISWSYNSAEKKLLISVEQKQNRDPFIFPLDILIVTGPGKSWTETLQVNKKKETFTFSLNNKPQEIIADPHTSLLFEGHVKEQN
ncbi:MAG: M1 family aminopeptidase [Chitinophagaceae bacterium]